VSVDAVCRVVVTYPFGKSFLLPREDDSIGWEATGVNLAGFLLLLLTAVCMAVANVLMKTGIDSQLS
jgi:hypothetical protein